MLHKFFIILSAALLATGCVTSRDYIGLEPLDPVPGKLFHAPIGELYIPEVSGLTPELSWQGVSSKGFTYDLAVWPRPETSTIKLTGIQYSDPEYYREGIDDTTHTLEIQLLPDTVYMWTVRPRSGNEVGQWSAYKEQTHSLAGWNWLSNVNYSFKTPDK